jgi:hypothetical protein
MSYNGLQPNSSGKDKVGKVCLATGHHGPVVARISSEHMSYNGPPPTSSGKDKVGKLYLTTGHHRPVVARIRSENSVLQWAIADQ